MQRFAGAAIPFFAVVGLLVAPTRAHASRPSAMVLPVSPVPGVSPTIADALGREVAAALARSGWEVQGTGVTGAAVPADCRPERVGPPGSPGRTPSPGFPACACAVVQRRGSSLLVVGRLSRLVTEMTLTLVAYAAATCAPLSAEGSHSAEIDSENVVQVAAAAVESLVGQLTGMLAVSVTPEEATISVDDEPRGSARVELRLLEGRYEVSGSLAGHVTERELADVSPGERTEVVLALEPVGGSGRGEGEDDGGGEPGTGARRPTWQTPTALGALGLGAVLGAVTVANATRIGDCANDTCSKEYEAGTSFYLLAGGAVVTLAAGGALLLLDF